MVFCEEFGDTCDLVSDFSEILVTSHPECVGILLLCPSRQNTVAIPQAIILTASADCFVPCALVFYPTAAP